MVGAEIYLIVWVHMNFNFQLRNLIFCCMSGLMLACTGVNSYEYLDGAFIDQDLSPTDLLTPISGAKLIGSPKFVWTKRSGAIRYKIEMAYGSNFVQVVLSKILTSSEYQLDARDLIGLNSLDSQSYYWRVSAEYRDKLITSAPIIFHVMDSSIIYVSEIGNLNLQIGNKSYPFTKIQYGIEAADTQRNGIPSTNMQVYVAAGTYLEEINLKPGISLRGGFESQSWTRNMQLNQTTINAAASTAIRANSAVSTTYTATTVVQGFRINAGSGPGASYGFDLTGSPTILSNTINAVSGNPGYGIYSTGASPVIVNNVITGGTGLNSTGVFATAGTVISNNTINGGSGNFPKGLFISGIGGIVLTNNIIYTTGGITRYCVEENSGVTDIDSFQNNLLFDCPTALYRDEGATNRTTEAELNNPAMTTQGTAASSSGNLGPTTIANFAAVFFGSASDLHLTAATPTAVHSGGKDASQSTCGALGASSCGNVNTDRDGNPRTVPYSIGAYEY